LSYGCSQKDLQNIRHIPCWQDFSSEKQKQEETKTPCRAASGSRKRKGVLRNDADDAALRCSRLQASIFVEADGSVFLLWADLQ
jgi:hypothetical protein